MANSSAKAMRTNADGEHGVTAGGNRQLAIIEARKLFVAEGMTGFSMRKVAKRIEISLGHLQHYFPTREDLLNATLEYTAASYITAYEDIVRSAPSNPRERFASVIRYLLNDIDNQEVRVFFVEVWPVTVRHPAVAALLKRVYQANLAGFTAFVRDARGDLPDTKISQLSLQILCLIDGLLLYQHTMQVGMATLEAVKAAAFATIEAIVFGAA